MASVVINGVDINAIRDSLQLSNLVSSERSAAYGVEIAALEATNYRLTDFQFKTSSSIRWKTSS